LIFPLSFMAAVPGWLDILSRAALIFVALALIVVAVVLILVALRIYRAVNQVLERSRADLAPILQHATSVADNVDHVTTAIRSDVQMLQQTVASAKQRVNRVAALAEQRVNELNALLGVIQEEAEELFVSTASTVRGVRASREALRRFREEDEYGDPEGLEVDVEEIDVRSGTPRSH
jgi:endonuclease/exonuclease/phosphatase (EEP) superfamily protein YafD